MNDHMPSDGDLMIADHIEKVVGDFLHGKVTGIAMCAIRSDGTPLRLYIDKNMKHPALVNNIRRLQTEIEDNTAIQKQSTAPFNNRSYRTH